MKYGSNKHRQNHILTFTIHIALNKHRRTLCTWTHTFKVRRKHVHLDCRNYVRGLSRCTCMKILKQYKWLSDWADHFSVDSSLLTIKKVYKFYYKFKDFIFETKKNCLQEKNMQKHTLSHTHTLKFFTLPFWAGWALMKCSLSSFSFCVTWPRRRQHPLAWFLSFWVVCLFSSLSSTVCTPLPLPPTSLTLHSPCLYLPHREKTGSVAPSAQKVWKGHKLREIPPPVQPPG